MRSREISRREFIARTAAVTGGILLSPLAVRAAGTPVRTAADQVTLGKTGIKLSRLGVGTGSKNGSIQRALGYDGFTRLIRYAYDQGITYIDTADAYRTHEYVGRAIKGLPREKLFIQSKMPGVPEKPLETLDRYRQELGVEYIDSCLVHCTLSADWDDERKRVLDALQEAFHATAFRPSSGPSSWTGWTCTWFVSTLKESRWTRLVKDGARTATNRTCRR
jgi:aryl-alcohol dehydrogenase-like predicted oxidoreductase